MSDAACIKCGAITETNSAYCNRCMPPDLDALAEQARKRNEEDSAASQAVTDAVTIASILMMD